MKNFLESGKESEFNELIISMRKDLYGIKTKISMRNLKLLTKPD